MSTVSEEKKLTLEEQYKLDKERRLNNTVKILKSIAEENMSGKEKEEFLKNLGEESSSDKQN